MPGLRLKNVTKAFDGTAVLSDITLDIAEGELLVVLGPSGCGKSTLLRLIAGLEILDRGEIYLDEKRIDLLQPKDRNVAMVFQNYSLYPHMTVEKNLAFPLKVKGENRQTIQERVREVAALLGLSDRLASKPGQLSGGQRQRVALGRAIVRNPAIFLLDEPLSNLDADLRVRMRQEISRIQKELNTTMIHVTHDQVEALTMADSIAVLQEGRLSQVGTPVELYEDPDNLFVAQFIGTPQLNVVDSIIKSGRLFLFNQQITGGFARIKDQRVRVGIRPERIRLTDNGSFQAMVKGCEYLGDQYLVNLIVGDQILIISGLSRPFSDGANVNFNVEASDLMLFDIGTGDRLRLE